MNTEAHPPVTAPLNTNLGDLISAYYEEFLLLYGDPDMASVAVAAAINDLLLNAQCPMPAN